jgi:hypothetical protein
MSTAETVFGIVGTSEELPIVNLLPGSSVPISYMNLGRSSADNNTAGDLRSSVADL